MITTAERATSELKESPVIPNFRLEPPPKNPLVPSSAVSVTEADTRVALKWAKEFGATDTSNQAAERIGEQMLERSKREVAKFPSSSRVRTSFALSLMHQGKLQEAIPQFKQALELDPKNFAAAMNLARALILEQRFHEAEQIYRSLQAQHPQEAAPVMSLAYLAMRRADYVAAEKHFGEAIKLPGGGLISEFNLALVQMKLGKYRDAIAHLKNAARSNVRAPSVYQGLAVAYVLSGDLKKAARSFQTVLSLAPGTADAIHGLSNVFIKLENYDDAVQLLIDHLEHRPEDLTAREILGRAYLLLKRYPGALSQWRQVLDAISTEDPSGAIQRSRLANDIGVCYWFQDDIPEAKEWFRKAIELAPAGHPLSYLNLARAYVRTDHNSDALDLLLECRQRFPFDQDTRILRAAIFGKESRYERAIDELLPVLQWEKPQAAIYGTLAWLLTDTTDESERALDIALDGFTRYPRNLSLLNNLAYVYLMRARPEDAKAVLNNVPRGVPKDTAENVMLTATTGLLTLWEGDFDHARSLYKKAELVASLAGDRLLARSVRQKMHLEFARAYLRTNDCNSAVREARLGIHVKGARDDYKRGLLRILEALSDIS